MKNKVAIGCLIQWYEIELIEEYLQSVKNALDVIDNKENVIIDLYRKPIRIGGIDCLNLLRCGCFLAEAFVFS